MQILVKKMKGQDASGIIIIDGQERVLLVHHTYGKKQWSLPGGMVEDGESAWDAAERELKEGINITAKDIEVSGIYFQPHKNRYIYTFRSHAYEGELEVDNQEIDSYVFFGMDELPRPISSFTVERLKDAVSNTKTVFREEQVAKYEILE
ncbi:NUDIX domain-containing protein [Paenibacillus sp. AN1007]|uniref:NUDIX domain-containing protein n=1 Tax=Paenibacillus sp. AN1007 TaxID=3151385 RepID=A0AAU8NAS4_9BACL